ncbi:hypothetical protein Drorol1_Dr00003779 [Drosera rotundifolia]
MRRSGWELGIMLMLDRASKLGSLPMLGEHGCSALLLELGWSGSSAKERDWNLVPLDAWPGFDARRSEARRSGARHLPQPSNPELGTSQARRPS